MQKDAGEVQILGRIGKVGGKPRPIRVKLGNWENRRRVLLKAKMLKDITGFENIYVCPDLTRSQQKEDKKLRDQVRDFRIIKGGHDRGKKKCGQVVGYLEGNEEVLYKTNV